MVQRAEASFDDALKRACDVNFVPGCVYRSLVQEISYPGRQTSYSPPGLGGHPAAVRDRHVAGGQLRLHRRPPRGDGAADQPDVQPRDGRELSFTNISTRAFPQWGAVDFELLEGRSNYNAGDFTFTKRFSHRWQGSATYTLSRFRDADPNRDQWYIGSDGLVARRSIGFRWPRIWAASTQRRAPTRAAASGLRAISATAPLSTASGTWATVCS